MPLSSLRLASAEPADVPAAVDCVAAAFVDDPLMIFFYPGTVADRTRRCREFMSMLLRVRLALQMPAIILKREAQTLGLAMGYHTVRQDWPSHLEQEWDAFVDACPGLAQRFDNYDRISSVATPTEPHYYLGVLAIDPANQSLGLGGQLMDEYCRVSQSDPLSQGVYLETAKAENVAFYQRRGFTVRAEASLGGGRLWCMYYAQPKATT